ncbi:MAG: LicD family protein [Defluviitaleaceae bacterium]|nr:LicD family protein [Defluviitaleaceae bacterium]
MSTQNYNDKITIIVPVYNVEPYLRRCIKSLINQTHQNLEIILIDDGSPDNCGKICDDFAKDDNRIIVIHQQNAGVCAARNAALEIASGDFIGFVDSDDYVEEDMFEYMLENIRLYDAEIACCNYTRISRKGKAKRNIKRKKLKQPKIFTSLEAIDDVINNWNIRTVFWNKLFKREVLENFRLPEGTIYEFTITLHRLLESIQTLVLLPDPKYYYIAREDSYVATKSVNNQAQYVLSNISRYNDLYQKYPQLRESMMVHIVKGSVDLIRACHSRKEELAENADKLQQIGNFLKANHNYISAMKLTNSVTMRKLQYLSTLEISDLNRAELLRKIGIRIRKPYKKISKAKRAIIKAKTKFFNKLREKFNLIPPKHDAAMNIRLIDYSTSDQARLDKLHNIQMEMVDEFIEICDKHNLKYYLYGGTLLGAVRHGGFIPWDDDIDIVMLRDDYEKFAELCKTELDTEKYFFQTCFNDTNYPMLFGKIRMNNTAVCEKKWETFEMHKGIYIDILPLDNFPDSGRLAKRLLKRFAWLNVLCQTEHTGSLNPITRLLFKFFKNKPRQFNYNRRKNFLDKFKKYTTSKRVCSFGSHYQPYSRRVLQRKWFVGDKYMDFEGRKCRVPQGWEDYLLHLYGTSYMVLPPEEERKIHFNMYEVEFSDE